MLPYNFKRERGSEVKPRLYVDPGMNFGCFGRKLDVSMYAGKRFSISSLTFLRNFRKWGLKGSYLKGGVKTAFLSRENGRARHDGSTCPKVGKMGMNIWLLLPGVSPRRKRSRD